MASWRLAKSLETLRSQANAAVPNRSKAEDGTIGDAAHASRTSDHNPNPDGVVCALDLTHDPAGGFDSYNFADVLRQQRDTRIKYVISNKKIFYGPRSPSHGGDPASQWKWESYNGVNPHTKHVHISVGDARYYDKTDAWQFAGFPGTLPPATKPVLKKGSVGADVVFVQQHLGIPDDGVFGPQTEAAVKEYQRAHGLAVDGIVGPQTWASLLGTSGSPDWQTGITATEFGGPDDFERSAYDNHVITATEMGVALPFRFQGARPPVMAKPAGKPGPIVTTTIVDVGPWNTNDPYWQTPGKRPQAESGTDMSGRRTNKAGIDLTPAVARVLGIDGKGIVDWRFAQPVAKEAPAAVPTADVPVPARAEVKPMSDVIWTVVRYVLIAGGAFLAGKGFLKAEDVPSLVNDLVPALSGLVAALTALWGIYIRYGTKTVSVATGARPDVPTINTATGKVEVEGP